MSRAAIGFSQGMMEAAYRGERYSALRLNLESIRSDEWEMRPSPARRATRVEHLLTLMINHALYHSGEINRQRSPIRGSTGWERTTPS